MKVADNLDRHKISETFKFGLFNLELLALECKTTTTKKFAFVHSIVSVIFIQSL